MEAIVRSRRKSSHRWRTVVVIFLRFGVREREECFSRRGNMYCTVHEVESGADWKVGRHTPTEANYSQKSPLACRGDPKYVSIKPGKLVLELSWRKEPINTIVSHYIDVYSKLMLLVKYTLYFQKEVILS